MKKIEFNKYNLPAHWASGLINDDYSGFSDDEMYEFELWFSENPIGYCVGVEGEPEFRHTHDASPHILACDCLTFIFQPNP